MKKNDPATAVCAFDYASQRLGGKHKVRILWHLREDTLRYGQLRKRITGITPKMLAQVLREMEDDALLTRTVHAEVPPRVEYALTESARALLPFVVLLKEWASQQMTERGIPQI